MTGTEFYDWLTEGGSNDVTRMVAVLDRLGAPWCMIGGLAVNHWAQEPMVTRDVDIVISLDQVEPAIEAFAAAGFQVKRFPWSVNLDGGSQISIQISTDEMYRSFPSRGVNADIHGISLRVASLYDTLAGKLAAWSDKTRRPSKRQKDLTDIARLLEAHPDLEPQVPEEVRRRLRD